MTERHPQMRPHPEVVDTELDSNETVLLHLKSKMYFSLNATASRVWQGLKKGLTVDEISRGLQEEFEVEPERAEQAVIVLMSELQQQRLVEAVDQEVR